MDPAPRKRHRGFPLVSLPKAVEVLQTAGQFGTEQHLAAFAKYMGHDKPSGGAFRAKIAAYRDWGLISRAANERITFTELGRRLALPIDETQLAQDMQRAFLASDVFAEAYESSAKGVPLSIEHMGNTAVHNLGISPSSKADFARSFVESAAAVGLADRQGDGMVILKSTGDGAQVEAANSAVDPESAPRPVDIAPNDRPPADAQTTTASVHRNEWPIPTGQIVLEIQSSEPLPPTAYGVLGKIAGQLVELAELLNPPRDEEEYPS